MGITNKQRKNLKQITVVPTNIKATPGMRCYLTPDKISRAKELSELGCKDKDIYNILNISDKTYYTYLREATLIQAYADTNQLTIDEIPDVLETVDEEGTLKVLYNCVLKCQFRQAILEGRSSGNEVDLRSIRDAGKKDWKATAYVLEKRAPEYKNQELSGTVNNNLNVQVDGQTFLQGIINLAATLDKQNKEHLNTNNDVIDVPVKKLSKADLL